MVGIFTVRSKTSKLLAERLGVSLIYPNQYYNNNIRTIIRWGTTATGSFDKEINSQQAVINASNKKLAREILKENDIPVPEMTEDRFPVVGRPTHHTKGRRFFYCIDQFDVSRAKRKGATYFSSYYPKTREYRIHIGGGKLLGIALKEGGDIFARNWNFRKGFRFRYLRFEEWNIDAIRLAKKAIKALGLDFGACDVMTDPKDSSLPSMVITEINTAPALCNFMLNKYTEYFKRVTQEEDFNSLLQEKHRSLMQRHYTDFFQKSLNKILF